MAVCCKPTENVATQSPTTNSPGRFLQDSSTGDPMHSQIGYKNGFRMPEEIQSFKWQNQPFVKLEVDHEQPNSLCNLTELTGIDPICSSMLSDELASTFEFMEHRPTSNKPCDRPYFEVESNFSVATRPSYCDDQIIDGIAQLQQCTTQSVVPPVQSFSNGATTGGCATSMELPMEELVWNDRNGAETNTRIADPKAWQTNADLFGDIEKTSVNQQICEEQYSIQSLIDGRDAGPFHQYLDSDYPASRRDNGHHTYTEMLKTDDPIPCSKYPSDYEPPRYPTVIKTRGSSRDSGLGGSVVEFSRSPTPGHEVLSMSPNIAKRQICYIDGFTPAAINEATANKQANVGRNTEDITEDNMALSGLKIASKKTAYNEKWGVKVLKAWCSEVKMDEDFESFPPKKLNEMLSKFWSGVRKSNGDYYGRNSLFNLRAMINKHLKGKPHCVDFDIVTDDRFRSSNDTLEEQLKILNKMGKTITHKEPLSLDDYQKLYTSGVLSSATPQALLRKVWFEITLYFCQNKRPEPQEKLNRETFDIYMDLTLLRSYIARTPENRVCHDREEVRLYETNDERCPVRSFRLYLQKLHPQQPRLFQQPRRKCTSSSTMWYGKAPIGEKALQQMMANISVAANLSKRYTNHCVRTTAIEYIERHKGSNRATDKFIQKKRSTEPYLTDTTTYQYRYNDNINLPTDGVLVPTSGLAGNPLPPIAVSNRRHPAGDRVTTYSYGIQGQNIQEFRDCREEIYKNSTTNSLVEDYGQAYRQTSKRSAALFPVPQRAEEMVVENPIQVLDTQPRKKSKFVRGRYLSGNDVEAIDIEAALPYRGNFVEKRRSSENVCNDFMETIISGDGRGIPEIECISNENYATLSKIVQA